MKKRILLILFLLPLAAAFILYFLGVESVPKKNFVVGIINPNPGARQMQSAFMKEISTQTWKQGVQLKFVVCNQKESLKSDLDKLALQLPDLLFAVTTPGTKTAREVFSGKNVPGVFILFDPVQAGIIKKLSYPAGNFTGVKLRGNVPKALEWLLTIDPEIENIFVPIKFDTPAAKMSLEDLEKAAKMLGVGLEIAKVGTRKELDMILGSIPEDVDAIFLLNSIFISTHASRIAQEATRRKLPTGASIDKAQEGVLLTYSTKHESNGKQAARLAYLLLQGQNSAEIPTEIADYYFTINLKTAEQIELLLSDNILVQADEVIR